MIKKVKLKISLGFHIPFEYCDKCKNKCENQDKNHSKWNIQRKKIAEYLRQMSINVYTYNSLPEMYDALGFACCFLNNGYEYFNQIILIDVVERSGGLVIAPVETEDDWYKELQKDGKISYIQKHCLK